MKKLLAIMTILSLALLSSACAGIMSPKFRYVEVEGGVALIEYSGLSSFESITIDVDHNGTPVVEIREFSVACSEYLKEINIGANVEIISPWAFTDCLKVERFNVDPDNQHFASVDGVLYDKEITTIISYPNSINIERDKSGNITKNNDYIAPDSVTTVGENAFYGCDGLGSVSFTENSQLITIMDRSFLKCVNMTNIRLPDGLITIKKDSLSYCDSLEQLYIPASVREIAEYGIYGFLSITELRLGMSEEQLKVGNKWRPYKAKTTNGELIPILFNQER